MAVRTNGTPASSVHFSLTAGVAATFTYNCPANTDCLVLFEAAVGGGGAPAPPAAGAVTYNGVALTMVPGSSSANNTGSQEGSIWYLLAANLSSGSHTFSITYTNTLNVGEFIVVPLIGVGQSAPVGTGAVTTGNSATPAVTATGGGTNDLYLAGMQFVGNAAVTDTGSGQTQLKTAIASTSYTLVASDISGGNPGAFSWSITSGQWNASAAAFFSPDPRDALITGVTTDLVLYNQNWNYAAEASTNFIQVGTTGAVCNNQSGGNFVLATWQGQQFTADQSSQVTLASFVSGAPGGVCVRCSNGAVGPNAYIATFDAAHYSIGLLNNGALTSLTGQQARASNPGDIVLLQVQGTTITLFVNGVTLTQVTDSTFAAGSPGLAYRGVHPSTVVKSWVASSLGILVQSQNLTSAIGQLGFKLSVNPTQQTATYSQIGNITTNQTVVLPAETATFLEGQIVDFLSIFGQTATFAEGSLTFTVTGGATVNLAALSIGGVVGNIAEEIDYILDQNAIIVIGQNVTSTEGLLTFAPTYSVSSYTITDTNGTILSEVDASLTAQSITSSEGLIVATTGAITNIQLAAQSIVSLEGLSSSIVIIDPVTGQTLTLVEGNLTFSNTGNLMANLLGQLGSFVSGSMGVNIIPVTPSGYPNLAGLILEDATQRLEVAGAIVPASIGYFGTWPITVNWVPSQVPPFVVLSQSIPPFGPIVANAPVTLTVSQPSENVAYP